jgi:hypothetical protein
MGCRESNACREVIAVLEGNPVTPSFRESTNVPVSAGQLHSSGSSVRTVIRTKQFVEASALRMEKTSGKVPFLDRLESRRPRSAKPYFFTARRASPSSHSSVTRQAQSRLRTSQHEWSAPHMGTPHSGRLRDPFFWHTRLRAASTR